MLTFRRHAGAASVCDHFNSCFISAFPVCSPMSVPVHFVHFLNLAVREVSVLKPLKEWCEENKKPGQKFHSAKEMKQFAKDKGIKLVKEPKSGEYCVPILDKTLMVAGNRHSASKIREQAHDSRKSARDSFEKQRAGMKIQSNSKALAASAYCDLASHIGRQSPKNIPFNLI